MLQGRNFVATDYEISSVSNGQPTTLRRRLWWQGERGNIWTTSTLISAPSFSSEWDKPSINADIHLDAVTGTALGMGKDEFASVTMGLRIYEQWPNGDIMSRDYNGYGPSNLSRSWDRTETVIKAGPDLVANLAVVPRWMGNGTMSEERIYFARQGSVVEATWELEEEWKAGKDLGIKEAARFVAASEAAVYWQHRTTGDIRETNLGTRTAGADGAGVRVV